MARTCCVVGCNVRSHDRRGKKIPNGVSFYCFPAWKHKEGSHVSDVTKRRRMSWISAIRRADIHFTDIPRSLKVCSRHFHSGKPAYEMDESHPDWAPTLHLGYTEVKATVLDRHARNQNRNPSNESGRGDQNEQNIKRDEVQEHDDRDQSEADMEDSRQPAAERRREECRLCERNSAEMTRLLQENMELNSEINKLNMDEEFFRDDTEKVRYYTGLPCFASLSSTFTTVKPFLPAAKKLSQFQMVLLTLIRLRLDLPIRHLSHIFHVSRRTVSATFADTVDVLYARLAHLLYWPERDRLQAFGKRVAIIVDRVEIRTERPSNLLACAQSFSHHKGAHTMKYLIGMTPQGQILFISKGWGGRASDRHIIENCGLLDKMSPGDLVLAHQGFDIEDGVGTMCAEVKLAGSGRQLDVRDAGDTSHLRIHVEKFIGSLRDKYTVLRNTIPSGLLLPYKDEELTLLDKIVNVCCVLVNMCPSVAVNSEETEECA